MPITTRRLSALALPAFPLALLAGALVVPTDSTENADQLRAAVAHGTAWCATAFLELLAAALLPVAAAAVVRAVRGRGTRLATAGAILGVLGTLGMASIALRHAYVYGLATADRATALHAMDRLDHAFGAFLFPLMLAAPLTWIVLAAAAARAGLVARWVPVGAVVFLVSDMLPIPAAEIVQGLIGLVTFTALAVAVAGRGAAPSEERTARASAVEASSAIGA
jgi:hypothetical protein